MGYLEIALLILVVSNGISFFAVLSLLRRYFRLVKIFEGLKDQTLKFKDGACDESTSRPS
jgi:hypothetical protein